MVGGGGGGPVGGSCAFRRGARSGILTRTIPYRLTSCAFTVRLLCVCVLCVYVCRLQKRGVLRKVGGVQRITFTEITKSAVTNALAAGRQVRAAPPCVPALAHVPGLFHCRRCPSLP